MLTTPTTRTQKELWCFNSIKNFAELGEKTLQKSNLEIALGTQKFIFETTENDMLDTLNLDIKSGATVTHIRLHNGENSSLYLRKINVEMAKNSTYNYFDLSTGFSNGRSEIFANLNGENSHINVNSIALLHKKNTANFVIHTNFKAENCTANIVNKNLVAGSAYGVFQGKFLVEKQAQKTDAFMLCSNLLLSEKSKASHKPELEIYADDVKCSHGATTGQLDETQLFYLQARGLSLATAKQTLITAQIADLINKIEDVSARIKAEKIAVNWLKKVTENEV